MTQRTSRPLSSHSSKNQAAAAAAVYYHPSSGEFWNQLCRLTLVHTYLHPPRLPTCTRLAPTSHPAERTRVYLNNQRVVSRRHTTQRQSSPVCRGIDQSTITNSQELHIPYITIRNQISPITHYNYNHKSHITNHKPHKPQDNQPT